MDNETLKLFNEKFKVQELTIYKNEAWTWSVRPTQPTLGSGILSLNRYALYMSEVTSEEMKKLGEIIEIIEKTAKQTFNYNIMNYLMLMMVDHHVHYHVIPRYDSVKEFDEQQWVDNGWPAIPVLGDNQHSDNSEILFNIKKALIKNL